MFIAVYFKTVIHLKAIRKLINLQNLEEKKCFKLNARVMKPVKTKPCIKIFAQNW